MGLSAGRPGAAGKLDGGGYSARSQEPVRQRPLAGSVQLQLQFLNARPRNSIEIVQSGEHIPWLRPIRRAEYARRVQLIDDPRRAPVADFQAPLQQRRRSLLVLNDNLRRLAE